MKRVKIKVSRQGLTRCPSCKAHIQVATPLADTVCPFCQSALAQALAADDADSGPLARLMGTSRSAVIAASLLGVPVLGACDSGSSDSGSDPTADVAASADVALDSSVAAVYGMPADITIDAGPVPEEVISAAEYGMPADIMMEPDAAEEPVPSEAYGMPPETPDER